MTQLFHKTIVSHVVVLMCLTLCACGGSSASDPDPVDAAGVQVLNTELPAVILNDDEQGDDDPANQALQCSGGPFDVAELLFTEVDRQWFCTVESTLLASSDNVYFNRDGSAEFTRFGVVYWNRNLAAAELNIASPFVSPFVIGKINSSNTTMQFNLRDDSGTGLQSTEQQYDCVLVGRDDLT